jgi:hypothetical protein
MKQHFNWRGTPRLRANELAVVAAFPGLSQCDGLFKRFSISQRPLFPRDGNGRFVAVMRLVITNARLTGFVVGAATAIDSVLTLRSLPKIIAPIVESIARFMVSSAAFARSNNDRLHVRPGVLAFFDFEDATSVKAFSSLTPLCVPLPLTQHFKIGFINEGNLALSEGDNSMGHRNIVYVTRSHQ